MYSFGIVSYNQEKDIIRALESIKYQVEKYSNSADVELILADDGSKDNTVLYARKWLDINRELFKNVTVLEAEMNRGTCKNIGELYRHLSGDSFFCFAADDAIAHNNVFTYLDNLKGETISSACYVAFSKGQVLKGIEYYQSLLSRTFQKESDMKKLSIARVPIDGPTMAFSKELLDKGLISEIEKYSLIEDRPTVYYLFKNHNEIHYSFVPKVYMLYQHSERSVSHSSLKRTRSIANEDFIKFFFECSRDKDNPIAYRYIAFCNYMRFKGNRIFKYINFPYYYIAFRDRVNRNKSKEFFKTVIEREFQNCSDHLKYLEEKAVPYYDI